MYSKRSGLILGFHGCDRKVRDKVVSKKGELLAPSTNEYDWLGNGMYFWENNESRALHWAKFLKNQPPPPDSDKTPIKEPSVLGAIIDLGFCLDLLDSKFLSDLRISYDLLVLANKKYGLPIPKNVPLKKDGDLIKRYLDKSVIDLLIAINTAMKKKSFDSVRGVFFEGEELYPNAGFKEKNHIQIAVRNPNCIKGFFIPREIDSDQLKP